MFNLFSWQEEHLTIVSGRLGGIIVLCLLHSHTWSKSSGPGL